MSFLTCSYPPQLKRILLRAFLESCFPEMLSKVEILAEGYEQVKKKRRAIALAARGGGGGLGQLWEALAEIFDVMFCAPVAQNLSKVSQMHPENMQEHFLRFSALCSAHSSPELVKSIPNAPIKHARAFLKIFAVMFCAQ